MRRKRERSRKFDRNTSINGGGVWCNRNAVRGAGGLFPCPSLLSFYALSELGKACCTIFLCRYLRQPELCREINEGLNVVENWNSANDFILFGKSSEIASNRRSDQEMTMLALHLLQNSLVYINTLMLQQVLAQDSWQNRLTKEDWRGLTPLFYLHINPYGEFSLDMTTRLGIEETVTM